MFKIRNITNNNGREVVNQFIIETDEARYFQSYNSIIVKIEKGKVYLDKNYWNYSTTTSKYRNQFLEENRKETENNINNGEDTHVNLY